MPEADGRTRPTDDPLATLEEVLDRARRAGADAADALVADGTSVSVSHRLGVPEDLERSEGWELGLRVFVGKRQAVVSSSDPSPDALAELVERAVAMARTVPEDEFAGLADADRIATGSLPDLDDEDPETPSQERLKQLAAEAEDAARAVDGVTNSEGADAGWGRHRVALAATNGFAQVRSGTRWSFACAVLAGSGTQMERDYDYAAKVFGSDLPPAEEIGRGAAERAVRRLGARKAKTAQVPVVFDPRVGNSIVGHLASAVNGQAVARGTTFLKEKMGERVFAPGVHVIDDPHRLRGLRSKPFDGEGLATSKRNIVADGVLDSWILDLRSARQLGLESTGHASRGTSSPPSPSPTNLYLAPGTTSRDELIGGVEEGFYVTELMGFGVNMVTGDYSRGAAGFWIENGEIAYPVSEVTIAGSLAKMFLGLTPANDLEFRYGTNTPTLRIDGMTVAGS